MTTPCWKADFPVSWVDDHYVTRREFTKSLALVSFATFAANAALVGFGAVQGRRGGGRAPAPARVATAAEVAALPVGGSKPFRYPGPEDPCLLIRLSRDRYAAYSQTCTHLRCPVYYRAEAGKIHCPCHEGYFDPENGKVLAGPPPRPLPRVELESRGDGIWAVGIRRDEP